MAFSRTSVETSLFHTLYKLSFDSGLCNILDIVIQYAWCNAFINLSSITFTYHHLFIKRKLSILKTHGMKSVTLYLKLRLLEN